MAGNDFIKLARDLLSIESRALEMTAKNLGPNFSKAILVLDQTAGRVVVTGMGKSGIIAQKIAATFSSTGTPSIFMHPAEALHGDLGMIRKRDCVIALSNSGETREILSIIPSLRILKTKLISITGNIDSTLARESHVPLVFSIQKEGCPLDLAPMASTTASLALGDGLAACLMAKKKITPEQFSIYHPHGNLGKMLTPVGEIMHRENMPVVSRETSLVDIIDKMVSNNRGAVLVTGSKGHLRGIISDGDLKRHLRKFGANIFNYKALDLMVKNPKYLNEKVLLEEALHFMNEHKITVAPVLHPNKRVAGLIQLHDLLAYKPGGNR